MKIDWDKIEDAVADYGEYCDKQARWGMTRQETEADGFEATMVKIHNEIRKARIGSDDECPIEREHECKRPCF